MDWLELLGGLEAGLGPRQGGLRRGVVLGADDSLGALLGALGPIDVDLALELGEIAEDLDVVVVDRQLHGHAHGDDMGFQSGLHQLIEGR